MKQTTEYIILTLIFCIIGCGENSQNQVEEKSNSDEEFYSNGFIKQKVVEKTDTSSFVQFYNQLDSGRIDSAYYYELFRDTVVAFDQYILDEEVIAEDVDIEVKGDSLEFSLKNQKYFWISLELINEDNKLDSMIWYNIGGNTSQIKILKPNNPWSVNSVHDWGVWVKGNDSIGRTIRRIYRLE